MSRCLVTGGAGFIGSHVVDLLIEEGHQVITIDNFSTGKELNLNPKADLIIDDITTYDWDKMPKVDYVFHLAALARIQPSIEDPLGSNEVNLTGTIKILEYCRRVNAKIIFSSSSSIYKGDISPTAEYHDKLPQSPYGLQKYLSEQYIELYNRLFGLKYTILRYFNVYGERQITSGAYSAIVGIFLDQKKKGLPLTITNDGEQRRDFTYVKDIARGNLMCMDERTDCDIINLGTGKNYSINELADFVGGEKQYIGNRMGEARETLANNKNALTHGWKPTKDIKDWVNEVKNKL